MANQRCSIAEREQRRMSELLRLAFRSYERSRPSDTEDEAETARRLNASMAAVRRGEYADYDEKGLRSLGKKIIAEVRGLTRQGRRP